MGVSALFYHNFSRKWDDLMQPSHNAPLKTTKIVSPGRARTTNLPVSETGRSTDWATGDW